MQEEPEASWFRFAVHCHLLLKLHQVQLLSTSFWRVRLKSPERRESFGIEIAGEKKKKTEHAKRIAHLNSAGWGMAQQLHEFGFFAAMLNFWHLIYTASLQLKVRLFQTGIQSKGLN